MHKLLGSAYLNLKKNREIWMIFDIENSLWKSDLGTFWQTVILLLVLLVVQNSLGCDMGMIIFDLHGYGGC